MSKFVCKMCGRTYPRAEGKCRCGANLVLYGEWKDEDEVDDYIIGPYNDDDDDDDDDDNNDDDKKTGKIKKQVVRILIALGAAVVGYVLYRFSCQFFESYLEQSGAELIQDVFTALLLGGALGLLPLVVTIWRGNAWVGIGGYVDCVICSFFFGTAVAALMCAIFTGINLCIGKKNGVQKTTIAYKIWFGLVFAGSFVVPFLSMNAVSQRVSVGGVSGYLLDFWVSDTLMLACVCMVMGCALTLFSRRKMGVYVIFGAATMSIAAIVEAWAPKAPLMYIAALIYIAVPIVSNFFIYKNAEALN